MAFAFSLRLPIIEPDSSTTKTTGPSPTRSSESNSLHKVCFSTNLRRKSNSSSGIPKRINSLGINREISPPDSRPVISSNPSLLRALCNPWASCLNLPAKEQILSKAGLLRTALKVVAMAFTSLLPGSPAPKPIACVTLSSSSTPSVACLAAFEALDIISISKLLDSGNFGDVSTRAAKRLNCSANAIAALSAAIPFRLVDACKLW